MTVLWVCPVQLTPHPDPFAAGSTPQPTGAVLESPKHDKNVCRAAVVQLHLPSGDITNASTSNPVFTAAMCAGVLFLFEVSANHLCGSRRISVCDLLITTRRFDGFL